MKNSILTILISWRINVSMERNGIEKNPSGLTEQSRNSSLMTEKKSEKNLSLVSGSPALLRRGSKRRRGDSRGRDWSLDITGEIGVFYNRCMSDGNVSCSRRQRLEYVMKWRPATGVCHAHSIWIKAAWEKFCCSKPLLWTKLPCFW